MLLQAENIEYKKRKLCALLIIQKPEKTIKLIFRRFEINFFNFFPEIVLFISAKFTNVLRCIKVLRLGLQEIEENPLEA